MKPFSLLPLYPNLWAQQHQACYHLVSVTNIIIVADTAELISILHVHQLFTVGNSPPTTHTHTHTHKIMSYNVTYKCTNAEFNMVNNLVVSFGSLTS